MDLSDSDVVDGPLFIEGETKLPEQGIMIEGYIVETLIRKTNNSFVFIGSTFNNGQKKALKFVKRRDGKFQQIKNEISLMKQFNSPRLLQLEARFPYKEYVCIVTQLASFQSLQAVIHDDYPGGIPEDIASPMMKQMLEAVQYLHGINIWHRDIKPDNFLVFDDNPESLNIVLCDFGYAKRYEEGEKESQGVGTPEFTAPEIIRKKPYTNSVDIWSLGISLFVMLTGQLPVPRYKPKDNSCPLAIVMNNLDYGLLDDCGISDEAKDLVHKMLMPKPKDRISIENAINHQWIKSCEKHNENETEIHSALFKSQTVTFVPGT